MNSISAAELVLTWQKIKGKKPRQEICAPLKWFCFILNFCIFLIGVTCLALGIYLITNEPRSISEWEDVFLNPAILITIMGLLICFVSLCGLFGALRDNVFLLKTFTFCVFCAYIALVIATFLIFMTFYSDNSDTNNISAHSMFLYFVKKYHTNKNIAELVDYIQGQLECCGASSMAQGYRDWQLNEQFLCNQSNPFPERCGVPSSCCRKFVSEATSSVSSNPLLPAMRSLQCWQNAQTKRENELETDIHVRGCLPIMRTIFERYAIHLGAAVAIIILPVCFGVCLSQCLARQIDYQKYLLNREARRHDRRRRRERRYMEQHLGKRTAVTMPSSIQQQQLTGMASTNRIPRYRNENLMEQGRIDAAIILNKSPPPNFPPPPIPRNDVDEAELAAAIILSKGQWYKDEEMRRKRQHRAVSTSPTRQRDSSDFVSNKSKFNTQTLESKVDLHNAKHSNGEMRCRSFTQLAGGIDFNPNDCNFSLQSQPYFLKQSDFT